jgi:MFS family permease
MKNKKIYIPIIFFVLVYGNQGLSGLPGQAIYYLVRENWFLTASQIAWVGFLTGIGWYIKPLFGFLIDRFPIKGFHSKYYLYINYLVVLAGIAYVVLFGLNIVSLVITGFLMNVAIAFCDVANDKQMILLEQKHKLSGKIQSIQWTALGVGGLIVSIIGAIIADKIPEPYNYKLAYALTAIVPLCILYYLKNHYKEKKVGKNHKPVPIKKNLKFFKDKKFLFGLLFISCLNFSPSFGTALQIQAREVLLIDKMFMGYLGATGTVLGLFGYALYYWKAHKFPLKNLLYFAIIFGALTNLFYLYIPTKWFILSYSVLFGAFGGISFLAILAYMASIVPRGSEAFFYAIVTGVSNLSGQLGNVFGGYIYDFAGYNTNVILATVTTLVCVLFIPKLRIE